MPLHLPGEADGEQLQLFEARAITQVHQQPRPCSRPPSASGSSSPTTFAVDSIVHVGGLAWALDWCPQMDPTPTATTSTAGPEQEVEVVAAAVHPSGHLRTPVGQRQSGRGAIQLWQVPRSSCTPGCPQALPQPLALILHEGLITWDVKWCPDASRLVQGLAGEAQEGSRWAGRQRGNVRTAIRLDGSQVVEFRSASNRGIGPVLQ